MKKVLVAMSGGVDSSVAAYLLREAGYECIGGRMKLFDSETGGESSVDGIDDTDSADDAQKVAQSLGLEYHIFDFSREFREHVIGNFIASYERGETPNPCVDCNRRLKFGRLYEAARSLGCEYIATGHYARVSLEGGRYYLKKAADPTKDQSYVLYNLKPEMLPHILFPLGGMSKDDVRRIAAERGFSNAKKKDSQDICFVPGGDYAAFIERITGKKYPHGSFIAPDGRVLGEHRGIIHYTIGQRRGLGLALEAPLYVRDKDTAKNEIILCRNDDLYSTSVLAGNFNWIACDTPPERLRVRARVRYSQREQEATVFATGATSAYIEFDSPVRAAAPGQAVVLYDGDIVVGGGTIVRGRDGD